jgi:hypothetical protein
MTQGAISLGPPPVSGRGIFTDGGTITIQTGGAFSNQSVVSTSGSGRGRDGGDITIIAGSINVQGPLLAVGSRGDDGAPGELPAAPGQDGGKGGMI